MKISKLAVLVALLLPLTACGGGGGQVASTPPPPPLPPPPPPPPPPPIPPASLGLVSSAPFATLGTMSSYNLVNGSFPDFAPRSGPTTTDVQFSYDASTNTYQFGLPDGAGGTLTGTEYNGASGQPATSSTSAAGAVQVGLLVPGTAASPYTYTSLGGWIEHVGDVGGADVYTFGSFVYGMPTPPGGTPITGSASYAAEIAGSIGNDDDIQLAGTASLQFDFGAGSLTGFMHPRAVSFGTPDMDFGQYDFTQTIYSVGSTTFSGKFLVPGLPGADSSFEGNFTGPNANELMARFQAPYLLDGQQGTMAGVWIGKKN